MVRPARLVRLLTAAPLAIALALGAIAAAPPAEAAGLSADGDPIVSGVPQLGAALTVIAGKYSAQPDGFDYQWYADGDPVGGSAAIHRPTADEIGAAITVDVTAHLTGSPDVLTTSAATKPVGGGGRVTAWGDDSFGKSAVPHSLNDKTVVAVAAGAGGDHSLALTDDGTVTAWGRDDDQESTVPASLDGKTAVAIAAGGDHSLALTDDGTVTAWGRDDDQESTVPASLDGKTVIAIAAGAVHSLALTDDGTVTAWGDTEFDQLDVPASLEGKTVVAIAAGSYHSLALTSDGAVTAWGFGGGEDHRTTVPSSLTAKTVVAIAAGSIHSLALTSDGAVTAWGNTSFGMASPPASLTGKTVVGIAGGTYHSLALTSDGTVTAWGNNEVEQTDVPSDLTDRTVTAISAGAAHNLAISTRSLVAASAPIVSGVPQLGAALTVIAGEYSAQPDGFDYQWYADGDPVGTSIPLYRPTDADLGKAITVDVTARHGGDLDVTTTSAPTAAVLGGGVVTAWGDNTYDQATVPSDLDGQTVTAIAGGDSHSLAVTAGGRVVAWGSNNEGQRNVPASLDDQRAVAVAAGYDRSLALTSDGAITAWGDEDYGINDIPATLSDKTVVDIAAGHYHTLALTNLGEVVAWGRDDENDVPSSLDDKAVVAIAAGDYHSLALTSDGAVTAWGEDYQGQADVPASLDDKTVVAIAAGGDVSFAVTNDGEVTAWGREDLEQTHVPSSLDDKTVIAIAVGHSSAIALASDGTITAWGFGTSVPEVLDARTVTGIAAGGSHFLALTPVLTAAADPVVSGVPQVGAALTVIAGEYSAPPDGFDYQWYADGDPVGTSIPLYRPTEADLDTTITVDVVAHHDGLPDLTTTSAPTPAVLGGGVVTAWGVNDDGQATVPSALDGKTVTTVAAGNVHSLALTSDGHLTAWGNDEFGQTDLPSELDGQTVTAVAAGLRHSLALTSDGHLTAWGDDEYGLDAVPASLDDQTVIAIAASYENSIALTSDGHLTAWGRNNRGQTDLPASLDDQTVVSIAAGEHGFLALTSDGHLTAWGDDDFGQTDLPTSLDDQTVTSIGAGSGYNVALTSEGHLIAWGNNTYSQTDLPTSLDDQTVTAIAAGAGHGLALTADGHVTAWGNNTYGQTDLPAGLDDQTVTSLAAGGAHTLALSPALLGEQPTITGTAQVGQTLTAHAGTITPEPDTLSYTWRADGNPIAGPPDAATYTPTPAQAGAQITVEVTATKSDYVSVSTTSDPLGPVANGVFDTGPAPTITGTAQVGQTLTAHAGGITPEPDALAYTWSADSVAIPGATGATYALAPAQTDAQITVEITATKNGYDPATATSASLGPVSSTDAPSVRLEADDTDLRRGRSTRLTWTSTAATSLVASGGWTGAKPGAGTARIRPRALGKVSYVLTATNRHGTTRARVAVYVVRQPARLRVRTVSGPRAHHLAGDKIRLRVRGLDRREPYRIRIGKQTIVTGKAGRTGRIRRALTLPDARRDTRRTIRVTGSEPDRSGRTRTHVLTRTKRLSLRLSVRHVRASDPITITAAGLAPRGRVTITYAGRTVTPRHARATRHGTYRLTIGADIYWGVKTVRITGTAPGRTATTTVTVRRRCPTGHICP